MPPNSLYIHIPFCNHRCGYCDFNTYAGLNDLIPDYIDACCDEIKYLAESAPESLPVHTIYFGGGTPSLVPVDDLKKLLLQIETHFELVPEPEITLEANPGTVSLDYLTHIRQLGINRLSLGMQSAKQGELILLERQHTFEDVANAVSWSHRAGIENLNLDLIYGLPYQNVAAWLDTLGDALSLEPQHLSLYALTLEHGTPMFNRIKTGKLPEPDSDLAADMYEAASDRLNQSGFFQYEISNWARGNKTGDLLACQHNLQYWRNDPYIGLGAGAHGYIHHFRTANVRSPRVYIDRMVKASLPGGRKFQFPRTPATVQMHSINSDIEIGETMMMGLRLVEEGVSNREFSERFGMSLEEKFSVQIERLLTVGLLEWAGEENDIIRLTPSGRLLGNQVFKEFI